MGVKTTRYPNMKILPNDGVKFKCECGCELEIYYTHCPECKKCCTSDSNSTIHNYWDNKNPNNDKPCMSYNFKKHLELKKMMNK